MTDLKNTQQRIALIVRRGALRRFAALTKQTEGLPVTVLWDQRQNERRGATADVDRDQRTTERRAAPTFTWELADFVVVQPDADPPPTNKP